MNCFNFSKSNYSTISKPQKVVVEQNLLDQSKPSFTLLISIHQSESTLAVVSAPDCVLFGLTATLKIYFFHMR